MEFINISETSLNTVWAEPKFCFPFLKLTLPPPQTSKAIRAILRNCTDYLSLNYILRRAPDDILAAMIPRYRVILPYSPEARRDFLAHDGLAIIQRMYLHDRPRKYPINAAIRAINDCFPEEAVEFFRDGYSEEMLEKVEEFGQEGSGTRFSRAGGGFNMFTQLVGGGGI